MLHLLIDFETTGLSPEKDKIIEIGAELVTNDYDHVFSFSTLVQHPKMDLVITPEIEEITGINIDMIKDTGMPVNDAFVKLHGLAVQAKHTIAYNAAFDEGFFRPQLERTQRDTGPMLNFLREPWLCAMNDVETNAKFKCKKLSHIALDHGIVVDPSKLHRAIDDVHLMRDFLIATGKSPQDLFDYKNIPSVYLQAMIPAPWTDKGAGTTLAKKAGFSYERAGYDERTFDKSWVKRVKQNKVEEEIKNCPFKIKELT